MLSTRKQVCWGRHGYEARTVTSVTSTGPANIYPRTDFKLPLNAQWKMTHELTVTSRSCCSVLGLHISLQRCPPSLGASGVCGAAAGSKRTAGIVIFYVSELNVKVKALMVLPGLGAWDVNLCPATVADVALSLCQGTLQPWLSMWAFHRAHCQNGWEEEKWREKRGWEEKTRRGSVRGSGGQAVE